MNYSVVIRTLGNGGEKYKKLIHSIEKQTITPKEIIVVLPYDYKLDYKLGNEKIIYCKKGMVNQRVVGINNADSKYILVLDDDISFDNSFAKKMLECIQTTNADVICPNSNEILDWKLSHKKTLIENTKIIKHFLLGNRLFHKKSEYAIKIIGTGGHSIKSNMNINEYYLSQSGNFQCFFIKTEKAKEIQFEKEAWVEATQYAIYDDQIFFYKAFLLGQKIIFAPQIKYTHLDGGAGRINTNKNDRFYRKLYGNTRNRTLFWRRFLYLPSNNLSKLWLSICYFYATINTILIYSLPNILLPKHLYLINKAILKGIKEGFTYMFENKMQ